MVWLEVETKVKINNVTDLRKKIQRIAKLEKKETRIDDYFAPKRIFKKYFYPKKAFRIRTKKDCFEINFKKWLTEFWEDQVVVKQEFEFKIKDKESIKDLIFLFKDLGFYKWLTKKKTCESYIYNKDKKIIIEINKVENLGYFMEIEYLAQPSEMNIAKQKIKQILKELKINPKDINNTGYTKMLWNLH